MKNLFSKIVSGVDIGVDGISVVKAVKSGSGIRIIASERRAFAAGDLSLIPGILKNLSLKYGLDKTLIVSAIPRHDCIVKYFTLPSVDSGEIARMIQFEIPRQLTLPMEKLSADYEIITRPDYYTDGKSASEIMLVAAKNDVIEKHLGLFSSAGLEPGIISINSAAITEIFKTLKPGFSDSVVILNLSLKDVDVIFLSEGRFLLKYSRSIPSSEEWIKPEKLLAELKQALGIFDTQSRFADKSVRQIFICGEGAGRPEYTEYLKNNLDAEISLFGVMGSESPESAAFAVAAGLAATGVKEGDALNLLPKNITERREKTAKKRKLVTLAVSSAALLILCAFLITRTIRKDYFELKTLDSKISKLKSRTSELEAIYDRMQMLNDYSGGEYSPLKVLANIGRNAGGRINLNGFIYEKGKSVTIKGTAVSYSDVVGLLSALEKSGYFSQVIDKGSRQETFEESGEKKGYIEFTIECYFEGYSGDKT